MAHLDPSSPAPSDARKAELRELLTRSATAVAHAQALVARQNALLERTSVAMTENRATRDETQQARATLQEAVRRYVAVLRDDGAPPERVVALVKTAAGPAIAEPATVGDAQASRVLMAQVVTWCIDAYYVA